jgi:hypothetical protein
MLALVVGIGRDLHAQTVRGKLTDSLSNTPLSSAFLTLVDAQSVERARAITNSAGEFTLTAPVTGTYRIRSKRIGFRPYVSAPLTLGAGETVSFNAAIAPIPVPLEQVVIAGERQCNVEAGASVAALWEEVKEALAAVAWTSKAPGYWYQVTQFERDVFTQTMQRGMDSTWRNEGFYEVPFRSVPAEQLEREGFVLVDAESWTYHEPDAEVLLSAPFLRTHCFETKVGKGDNEGLVGLAFSPARGRRLPDISGALWVDRQSAELRHLEFRYERLPQGLSAPNAGGRVDFMRVPTGAWMVRDWIIRMPIAREETPTYGSPALKTAGYRERGGSAVEIKTTAGAVVFRSAAADTARVMAQAAAAPPAPTPLPSPPPAPTLDGTAGAPPAGVEVAVPDQTRPSTAKRSRDLLLPDEFAGTSARDAFGLVQQYRPAWLRTRGASSMRDQTVGQVQVYVNGSRWGGIERLREIPLVEISELRYRSGQEATMRYGTNHAGGVIEIQTR